MEIASFLVVAATLMLIKSRALLFGFLITKEEEQDITELQDRLKAYKAVKEMAKRLGTLSGARQPLFSRETFLEIMPSFTPPPTALEPARMLEIVRELLQSLPPKNEIPQKTLAKIVSIEEKIKELETRITEGMVKTFSEFVGDKKERVNVIVSFLAMLELVKGGVVAASQKGAFSNISLEHGTSQSA